jgi:hypothetical protein
VQQELPSRVVFFLIFVNTLKNFRTYLFGLLVAVYTLTTFGIPVYFHYCGGELEKISYLVKSGNCCGDEEECSDCCSDEGTVLHNEGVTLVKEPGFKLTEVQALELAYAILPFILKMPQTESSFISDHPPTPSYHKKDLITIRVLRI